MSESSETYHEPLERLSAETRDMHRALVSMQEELEAVDWYRQRADACTDEDLRGVLRHNMREEMEHAMKLLEWVRRHDTDFEEKMAAYLYTDAPSAPAVASQRSAGSAATPPQSFRLTVGSLKGVP